MAPVEPGMAERLGVGRGGAGERGSRRGLQHASRLITSQEAFGTADRITSAFHRELTQQRDGQDGGSLNLFGLIRSPQKTLLKPSTATFSVHSEAA